MLGQSRKIAFKLRQEGSREQDKTNSDVHARKYHPATPCAMYERSKRERKKFDLSGLLVTVSSSLVPLLRDRFRPQQHLLVGAESPERGPLRGSPRFYKGEVALAALLSSPEFLGFSGCGRTSICLGQ